MLIGVALVVTSGFWIETASAYLCSNDHEWRLPSPDGSKVAVRFHRDCGAFGDPATNVSVLQRGEIQPNRAGNAYFAVDQGGPIEHWGGPSLRMHWSGNKMLVLTHDISDITWSTESPIEDVNVVVRGQTQGDQAQKILR